MTIVKLFETLDELAYRLNRLEKEQGIILALSALIYTGLVALFFYNRSTWHYWEVDAACVLMFAVCGIALPTWFMTSRRNYFVTKVRLRQRLEQLVEAQEDYNCADPDLKAIIVLLREEEAQAKKKGD